MEQICRWKAVKIFSLIEFDVLDNEEKEVLMMRSTKEEEEETRLNTGWRESRFDKVAEVVPSLGVSDDCC
mgnify:CR=1 FL=1